MYIIPAKACLNANARPCFLAFHGRACAFGQVCKFLLASLIGCINTAVSRRHRIFLRTRNHRRLARRDHFVSSSSSREWYRKVVTAPVWKASYRSPFHDSLRASDRDSSLVTRRAFSFQPFARTSATTLVTPSLSSFPGGNSHTRSNPSAVSVLPWHGHLRILL